MIATRAGALAAGIAMVASVAACATGAASPSLAPVVSAAATSSPTGAASESASPRNAGSPTVAPSSQSATPAPSGSIDPANFVATIDNPWFPLKPGSVWTYRGVKDGEPSFDVVTVTGKTKVIQGVTCVVVSDRLKLSGVLEETTLDYYAQDLAGNVWYFGEDTAELDKNGKVTSREGSWMSGVDGAHAGVFMEATPTVGKDILQEYLKGHAEDHFAVIDLNAKVTVPYGSFSNALETKEWTPLEPDVLDHKFYVQGVGEVREVAVKGPKEELVLISFKHG